MPRNAPVPERRIAQVRAPRQGAFGFLGDEKTDREPVSLATVDADTLKDAIVAWTELGHAITIGRTSDGGALAVNLLAGGERRAKYFSDIAAMEDFLVTLRDGASGR